jgi:hypothetical protein
MASNLDFLNKNLLRRYPFQASASLTSGQGSDLPLDLIASVSISTPVATSNIFVSQVSINQGNVSVTIEHYDTDPTNCVVLGVFAGLITKDFQAIRLTPFVPFVDGYMTFGGVSNIQLYNGFYAFAYADAVLEPTTVFCYMPPAVTSLNTPTNRIQGAVTFGTLSNLTLTTVNEEFEFQVTDTSSIESLADLSSQFNNCPTPVIYQINDATPYPHDVTTANDGNIYIIGVNPITFDVDESTGSLNVVTPGMSMSSLCTATSKVVPPTAPNYLVQRAADSFDGTSRYYSKSQEPIVNYVGEILPEFLLWPYYVKTFSKTIAGVTNGSYTIFNHSTDTPLLKSGQTGTIALLTFYTNAGSCTANFQIGATSQVPNTRTVTSEGLVMVPTASGVFGTTDDFIVDVSSVSGTPNLTVLVIFNLNLL